jgi:hypothetical protein
MNHPHYVIDWDSLDDAIDHCERYYGWNALAPIDRDDDAYWDGDERPTGFDFIEYRRAETATLGIWEDPNTDARTQAIKAFEQFLGMDGE